MKTVSAGDDIWMTSKRAGQCRECSVLIAEGDRMVWSMKERRAYCKHCGPDIAGPDPQGGQRSLLG